MPTGSIDLSRRLMLECGQLDAAISFVHRTILTSCLPRFIDARINRTMDRDRDSDSRKRVGQKNPSCIEPAKLERYSNCQILTRHSNATLYQNRHSSVNDVHIKDGISLSFAPFRDVIGVSPGSVQKLNESHGTSFTALNNKDSSQRLCSSLLDVRSTSRSFPSWAASHML
uniref:Uncharacterized protein n=1 Tax=Erythrolobus australicus TaxID=1077150 RepID=A0A7S1TKV7_9RHOD